MRRTALRSALLLLFLCVVVILVSYKHIKSDLQLSLPNTAAGSLALIKHPKTAADKIVNGAKMEVLRDVRYDAGYMQISYPGGDVPKDQGACTDVVIRALRSAGYDLQKLIHEDMQRNFSVYPRKWGLKQPDSNIDHRRVLNHIVFMKRHAKVISTETAGDAANNWKPGDIVYWNLGAGCTHCGIISNIRNRDGLPLVIHNIGPTANQQDCLNNWEIIGHFRFPKQ